MVTPISASEAAERLVEFDSVLGKLSGDRLLLCNILNLDRALEWGFVIEQMISNSSREQVEQFGEIIEVGVLNWIFPNSEVAGESSSRQC